MEGARDPRERITSESLPGHKPQEGQQVNADDLFRLSAGEKQPGIYPGRFDEGLRAWQRGSACRYNNNCLLSVILNS